MALDFPSSPALNQVFTSGNRSWIWNGTEWIGNTPIINYTANSALLGNGTSLFQEVAPGTAGNLLTSNGTTWTSATAPAGGITNVVTATGNTTLTSTPTLLRITPTGYGTTVKLPDATTMTVGAGKFEIQNLSNFHVRIANNSGTFLGFVDQYDTVEIELADNSTAAGVWVIPNVMRLGVSAERGISTTVENLVVISAGGAVQRSVVELDNDRSFILLRTSTGNIYGQVYDQSSNTFGSETLIRTAVVSSTSGVVRLSANSVLVASGATAAFEATVLSISGTTITVNTAATYTLPASVSQYSGLSRVPSGGFVYVYASSVYVVVVPMSVSGTTVSIGTPAATLFSNSMSTPQFFHTALDKIVVYSQTNGSFIVYSLSGTTLTAGSITAISGITTNTASKFVKLSDASFFFDASTSGVGGYVGVMSISGLVVTSYASANIGTDSGSVANAVYAISSTKVFFTMGVNSQIYYNILTFTPGTGISIGTPITTAPAAVSNNTHIIGFSNNDLSINANNVFLVLDVSGASPSVKSFFGTGSSILPNTNLYTGALDGLISNNVRVVTIASGVGNQSAVGLKAILVLKILGNLGAGSPLLPPLENSTFTWSSNVSGGRNQIRKFEVAF